MRTPPTSDSLPKGLSRPATRALTAAGYLTLASLSGASARDLLKLHGVGPSAIPVIANALSSAGLAPLAP